MIRIAHRGNTGGCNPHLENNPKYIRLALSSGFNAEVDVWWLDGNWHWGHDNPKYAVEDWENKLVGLWCHAKTPETLYHLMEIGAHCFFHDKDAVTLTSRGYLWTLAGGKLTPKSIAVLCEPSEYCAGVCLDDFGKHDV